ncbi:MAG: HAD family phosphatase [Candidatus Limnocylindrales bacterium]
MIQAIIFDMDGLLVDSEPVWDEARKWMADQAGKPWGSNDHHAVMGVSTEEWADYMIERLELTLSRQEVIDAVIGHMVEMYRAGVPYFPGAVELVEAAASAFRTALASGSHPTLIETVTADPPMRDRFEVIVAADDVGRGKPAPDVYLAAAERLGLDPADCVCLEDSGNGILSGADAGMKVVAVPDPRFPPAAEKLARAHLVVRSLTEVTPDRLRALG